MVLTLTVTIRACSAIAAMVELVNHDLTSLGSKLHILHISDPFSRDSLLGLVFLYLSEVSNLSFPF